MGGDIATYNNCTMEGDMVNKLNIIYYSNK